MPRFEVQFIKHGGFKSQLFSLLSRRTAFVYCTMEHFESSNLKLLQQRGYAQNCQCKQGNWLKCCYVALPNISRFQRYLCQTIYSPNITDINDNQEFLQFLNVRWCSVHNKKMVDAGKQKSAAVFILMKELFQCRLPPSFSLHPQNCVLHWWEGAGILTLSHLTYHQD